jgi:sec-independent protein translocase protein TatA
LAWTPFDPLHLLVIGVVALLLFGKRLPEVGRSLGKGISEFRKGLREVSDEIQKEEPPPPPQKLTPPPADTQTVARGAPSNEPSQPSERP